MPYKQARTPVPGVSMTLPAPVSGMQLMQVWEQAIGTMHVGEFRSQQFIHNGVDVVQVGRLSYNGLEQAIIQVLGQSDWEDFIVPDQMYSTIAICGHDYGRGNYCRPENVELYLTPLSRTVGELLGVPAGTPFGQISVLIGRRVDLMPYCEIDGLQDVLIGGQCQRCHAQIEAPHDPDSSWA